jgi:Tol biopolymer transport system component
MNIDGSNQIQLTDGSAKNFPAITPDGKWVLFNSTDRRLWKIAIEGGEAARLTDYIAEYPSVSPDRKTIACVGTDEHKGTRSILVLPFEGGPPIKAIEPAGARISGCRVQWAPDGKSLIYAANRNGTTSIIRQSLSKGTTTETVSFSEDELFDFGYSPDGKFFAVTRGGWQHDIVLISDINRF